ncbi:peptide/nickel transport system permease protein [Trueperella bonasi]|uniref:Peptide/nickel transport system permease protein n=1 Tax=Trueperella bonasi TaxID=312286 RepID=A0ABT9NHE3_9ACTO|nr:ABC transporter permease [Trueperella bonasi]MDP9806428.1 peptide/nickel transport system permease protein [Trueperella bonasi]
MAKFIAKRIGISALVLFVASVLLYVLVINSGDPLADLRESNDINRENLMEQRAARMGLHLPWYERYASWLRGVLGCFVGQCDFGVSRNGQSVNALLADAASSTIRLVLLATILGIVVGIFFGAMTAIRQYSGFDYVVTTMAFIFYSLPSFVFAVLLKEYGAIRYNNWLADPYISVLGGLLFAALFGLFMQAMVAGDKQRRVITFTVSTVAVFGFVQLLSVTGWFRDPQGSILMVVIVGVAAAVLFTALLVSLSNRRAVVVTLAVAGSYLAVMIAMNGVLIDPSYPILGLVLIIGIALAVIIPRFFGGYAREAIRGASIATVISMFVTMIVMYVARFWTHYTNMVGGRPISTIGSGTPNFRGGDIFWLSFTDSFTHLILPTISLTLMSVASYTRYTRSSMLESLGQDYVRTARAKGMPERTVITRHAFRNALLPITTIVAFDFAGLIGGAVITEKVFGWKGMGDLFRVGLEQVDPNPVMAFFVVTGTVAVLMNMFADIAYASIDPRIRR